VGATLEGVTPVGECTGGRWREHHGWVGGVDRSGVEGLFRNP
jgi:hypothetical protein